MTNSEPPKPELIELTTRIVSAYVGNNSLVAGDIPGLISEVHAALARAAKPVDLAAPRPDLKPAVAIKKSITAEYIYCLECGKPCKSLKRHLRTGYDRSPEQYRERWGLEHDYPMVAPNYAQARSRLAKQMGLGIKK